MALQKIIRSTLFELIDGRKALEITIGHVMHCIASLLQDVMCYADTSMPLRGPDTDGETNGHGKRKYDYVRKCRNWSAMAKWASERTACMTTSSEGILDTSHEHRENCMKDDGIMIPTM